MQKNREKRLYNMKTNEKRGNELLATAETFLELYGLTAQVDRFLSSEDIQQTISEYFSGLMNLVNKAVEKAPDDLKEIAGEVRDAFCGGEEPYKKDVIANYKISIYKRIECMPDSLFEILYLEEKLEAIYEEGEKGWESEKRIIIEILTDFSAIGLKSFMELLYENYVPCGTPKEVVDFMKMLSEAGYKFVSIGCMFPFDQEDDDEQNDSTADSNPTSADSVDEPV